MIKKTAPLPWHLVNTILLFLVLGLVIFFQYWEKAQPYWFISYEWTKGKDHGAGRTCIKIAGQSPDIDAIEKSIADKNSFSSVVIHNFREIDKSTYEWCIKKP